MINDSGRFALVILREVILLKLNYMGVSAVVLMPAIAYRTTATLVPVYAGVYIKILSEKL